MLQLQSDSLKSSWKALCAQQQACRLMSFVYTCSYSQMVGGQLEGPLCASSSLIGSYPFHTAATARRLKSIWRSWRIQQAYWLMSFACTLQLRFDGQREAGGPSAANRRRISFVHSLQLHMVEGQLVGPLPSICRLVGSCA
eukprot:scaffold208575_cov18-Tisochrysis_lutea.AAC.1